MARDPRAIGYDLAPPVTPDYTGAAAGAATANVGADQGLYVVFAAVRCTHDSYTIDAFIDQDARSAADVDPANPHYVGRFTRLGMGMVDDKGRCITQGVTRVLDATRNSALLGLKPGDPCTLYLRVTDLTSGAILPAEEYAKLPGFTGQLVWGKAWAQRTATTGPATDQGGRTGAAHSCCSTGPAKPAGPA
jgi:hypothetical protein